jgi:hypothetical protein
MNKMRKIVVYFSNAPSSSDCASRYVWYIDNAVLSMSRQRVGVQQQFFCHRSPGAHAAARFCRTNTYGHSVFSLIKNTASSLFPKINITLRIGNTGKAEQRQIATERGDGNDR